MGKQKRLLGQGDIFAIDEFIDCVTSGCITDYNGHGHLYDGVYQSGDNRYIKCDVEWLQKAKANGWPFVVWFNK